MGRSVFAWRCVPKIQWEHLLPKEKWAHLRDRANEKQISQEDLFASAERKAWA
jgi:hypothetical protein